MNKSTIPLGPELRNNRLWLRPVNPDDYKSLFTWHSDSRNLHLWWTDRKIMAFDDFLDDFRRRLRGFIQSIFMIDLAENEETKTVGMVYTYNTNLVDRYTYLCIYLTPQYTAKGIGPEAGYLMAEYLFTYFGFRKIYSEIFAYNEPSLKAAKKNGFEEEGCLKEHRWFGDRYWNLHILAITRENFAKLTASINH